MLLLTVTIILLDAVVTYMSEFVLNFVLIYSNFSAITAVKVLEFLGLHVCARFIRIIMALTFSTSIS